jgi:predicted nuclease of restriction endonuclease-like RecB superfamily
VIPRFLGFNDMPWLRSLIDEVERFAGRREAELDERLRVPIAESVDTRKQRLAVEILRRMLTTSLRGIQPRQARARLFAAAAASNRPCDVVALGVANEIGVSLDELRQGLFGDLPGQRIVTLPGESVSPNELALRANLALARGFLERACAVSIELEGNARTIVRQAKLRRLICGVRRHPADGAVLDISGPFALFRHTLVYGRALGELLPLLAWCRRFRLQATCVLGERSLTLRLASGDPIFPSGQPRRFDSKVEERFFRDISRCAPAWDVIREPEPVQAGVWLLFPDFALQHRHQPERRWCVEIIGFWTERYLEKKLAAYRAAAIDNLILCVADDLACNETDLPVGAHIIRYRRVVDPHSVLSVIDPAETAAPGGR